MRDLNAIAGATFVTGLLNVHSLHRDKTLPNSWSYNIEDKTTEVAEHSQRIVELLREDQEEEMFAYTQISSRSPIYRSKFWHQH